MCHSGHEPRGGSTGHAGVGGADWALMAGAGPSGPAQPLARQQPRGAGREVSGWTLTLSQGCESFLTRALPSGAD